MPHSFLYHPAEAAAAEPPQARSRNRDDIDDRFKWNLSDIFSSWEEWEASYKELEVGIDKYAALKGTLAEGPERLLAAFRLSEDLGQRAYRVWYFPALRYDEDQRDNAVNARRQQVQILFARWKQAESWFSPELLKIPLDTVRTWMESNEQLAVYRFAIEDLYRQQEHVLDEAGERLMSLASRLTSAPSDAYSALSTADARFPTITLSTGEEVTVSYGQYRAILATRRAQADRAAAFSALHGVYQASLNTYATLYNGVCQRDWFQARARGYKTTLEAALHGDNIPTSVVENLIETTRAGVEPLRRYHRLRRRILGVPSYHVYDFAIPIVTYDRKYRYDEVLDWIVEAVEPLGPEYQARMRQGFSGGWIDVYENEGKRSGAYSAPVYGTHPYMLLTNVREVAAEVRSRILPTDLIIQAPEWYAASFNHYFPQTVAQIDFPHAGRSDRIDFANVFARTSNPAPLAYVRQRIAEARREGRRVWLISGRHYVRRLTERDVAEATIFRQAPKFSVIRVQQIRDALRAEYGLPDTSFFIHERTPRDDDVLPFLYAPVASGNVKASPVTSK